MSVQDARADLQIALGDAYAIEEEIGRGGMGVVYRARDLRHDRAVAIKILREEISTSVGAARFQQEIRIEARLQHPNIVPVLEWGQRGVHVFCVMPLVDGEPLRERLSRERQLPVGDAMRIAREIADALAYAHEQGVVHRDVKPENILLSSGHAMLTDFGVARIVGDATERLTDSGFAVGTVAYMSPEQAAADSDVGSRSDIYSLGCVLYEMLAGEPPFAGATPQAIIARHLRDRPAPIGIVRPSVPSHVLAALDRAMEKVPADRFASATEFAAALEVPTTPAYGVSAQRVTANRQSPSTLSRAVLFGTACLVIAAIGGVWWKRQPPALDDNRVVVLPLQSVTDTLDANAIGWDVAIAIGASLEHAEPLRTIDGYSHLAPDVRHDLRLLTADMSTQLARARGARHYVDGAISRRGNRTEVVLRLHDAQGDSVVAQESASGDSSASIPTLGLQAAARLLPRLLDPTRRFELGDLTQRSPSALALWIQGEREYRQSRFASALALFRRAVREDSALVIAAVRGAQAASWESRLEEAEVLAQFATTRERELPARYRTFARGLLFYLQGSADSSRVVLEQLLASDHDSPEAAMALAEVHQHLLGGPSAPPDSAAEYWLRESIARDSAFSPPLFHLAEIALRRGEVARGESIVATLRARGAEPGLVRVLQLMVACVRGHGFAWQAAASVDAASVLAASRELLAHFAQPTCAEDGLRALLQSSTTSAGIRWSALLHLQGLLVATRRDVELRTLLDSTVMAGTTQARALYIIDAIAGVDRSLMAPKAQEAVGFAQLAYGPTYERASAQTRWVLGLWHAVTGDTARLRAIVSVSDSVARVGGRRERLFAQALRARLLLAVADSAGALVAYTALAPSARRDSLAYELFEPLGVERLALAELQMAQGAYAAAARTAAHLEQVQPAIYLAFLPLSLDIRARAADRLDKTIDAKQFRERLRAIERLRDRRR